MKISTSMLLGCLLIISCSHNEMISDKTITVFDKQTISFSPNMETDALDNMVSLGSVSYTHLTLPTTTPV